MARIPRPAAVGLVALAVGSAAAGLWLQATSGTPTPTGFLQYAAVAVGTGALGAFILWHRPRNRYGLTHLAVGVLFGVVVLAAGVLSPAEARASPEWMPQVALAASWLLAAALLPLWVIAIAAFPDGELHRRDVRRATIAIAIAMPVLAVVAYLFAPPGEPPPLIRVDVPTGLAGPLATPGAPSLLFRVAAGCAAVLGTVAPIGAVVALVDRFRTSGPVRRQQIKWLLVGAAISVAVQAIPVQALDSEVLRVVAATLVVLAVPLPLVAAAVAIFKHGLWEIDVVISKGLVYAVASGMLTVLFLGVALVAGVSVGGGDSRVVAALALALVVSFLAQPLRRRVETVVARVLFGPEPRGVKALGRLGDTAGGSLPTHDLAAGIADAARDALGASWTGVWLYVAGDMSATLRPVAVSGMESGPSAVFAPSALAVIAENPAGRFFADLPTDVQESLRALVPADAVLVAPLTSGGHLIGLILCGGARRGTFGEEDLELLAAVAHESALALRNVRLEEELRQRLEEIERQAADLRTSRQRLVTAQDKERQRIERDLHDGAQQQLVALAARLRRAARADDPHATLEELADEAEAAVFTLQELARGIYPSLLADRGLQAALQAQAARLPASVRVETDPRMHGRRLAPELEAAFYFVALEAMTNAVKHAPGARVIVSLRGDRHERTFTLEVHDDGPGFDAAASRAGGGLQNMADRIHALDGTFAVESTPGGGTWIRAEVEERAAVRILRSREATP